MGDSQVPVEPLDAFVQRFPWPARMTADGRPLEWLFHFDLDISVGDLWPQVIDTSRFNRALGLSRMQFEERDGVLHGSGKNGGFRQEWVEEPWDWADSDHLVAGRCYSRGFAKWVRVIYRLEPLAGARTRMYVYFGWIPRGWFGAACLRLGMPSMEREFGRVLDQLVSSQGDLAHPYMHEAEPPSPDAGTRVAAIRRRLEADGLDGDLVGRLAEYVERGDPMDVYRIQVRKLAHEWGCAELEILRVALHATRAGLLDMSWDVICPHCRGVRSEASELAAVDARGRCDVCDIDFENDRDNAIEITFHAHPAVRQVPKVYYCSAEPSSKLHIKLQQRLDAGGARSHSLDLACGRYRMRLKGSRAYRYLDVVEDGPGELAWDSEDQGDVTCGPAVAVELTNSGSDECTFVVEEVAWRDEALRPAQLFSFQEFRDLFSREYLGTDVHLSVGRQTILFTDIVGSTRFYASRGDPEAFMEVKRHFVEAREIVAANHGAIVKTIGDAIMAAFSDPVAALRCSKAIHECFHAERADSPVRVRISLNTGPCIAVKLNSDIDFFGNSVNLAAKLQACCEAGEIAFSEATYQAPGVAAYLDTEGASLDTFEFESKSLLEPVVVKRWSVYAPDDVVVPPVS